MRVLGQKSLPKLQMNADQTDLEARCLTIARQTSCITVDAVIQWVPNNLVVTVDEPVSFKKDKHRACLEHLKLSNSDSKYLVQWTIWAPQL